MCQKRTLFMGDIRSCIYFVFFVIRYFHFKLSIPMKILKPTFGVSQTPLKSSQPVFKCK